MKTYFIIGFFLVALVIIGAVFSEQLKNLFTPDPIQLRIAKECNKHIPKSQKAGLKITMDKAGAMIFDVSGQADVKGSNNVEIVSRILECVEKAYASQGISVKDWYIAKKPLPLGLVSQQWGKSGLSINLERPNSKDDESILNNFRFPPFAGPKTTAIENWCTANSSCVSCSPTAKSPEFKTVSTVTVELNASAIVEKRKMWGTWKNPKDPWELIDEKDIRYYYICKGG